MLEVTPQLSKMIGRVTTEVNLKPSCDILVDILYNGLGGFGANVKSCFILKGPEAIKYSHNNIQTLVVSHGSSRGPEIKENSLNISDK